jgi:hypothetical protein
VDFAIKTLFTPILDQRTRIVEVKQAAEDRETNKIHQNLRNSVFAGQCSNWYIGDFGRNAAPWPGLAASFWAKTYFPDWSAFQLQGGSKLWRLNAVSRWIRTMSTASKVLALLVGTAAVVGQDEKGSLSQIAGYLAQSLSRALALK